jgi:hypothetical protein
MADQETLEQSHVHEAGGTVAPARSPDKPLTCRDRERGRYRFRVGTTPGFGSSKGRGVSCAWLFAIR